MRGKGIEKDSDVVAITPRSSDHFIPTSTMYARLSNYVVIDYVVIVCVRMQGIGMVNPVERS